MNQLRLSAVATGMLFGLSLPGLALAGENHERVLGHGPGAFGAPMFDRADTNKDGQVTRAEAESAALSVFDRMDTNKNGEVTREEADANSKIIAREEMDARFKALDTNGDGRVSEAESKMQLRFFEKLDTNHDKMLSRDELAAGNHFAMNRFGFDEADTNHDGKVTRAEATQAAIARFDRADTNHDGVITRAELDAHKAGKAK